MNNNDTNGRIRGDGEKPEPHKEWQARTLRWETQYSSGKCKLIGYLTPIGSSENLYSVNIQTEQVIFKSVHVYTDMHIITINEKKGHVFERESGRIQRDLDGRNVVFFLKNKAKDSIILTKCV